MGCLQACNKGENRESSDSDKIFQAINLCSSRRLKSVFDYISTVQSLEAFDSLIIEYQNVSVNALGVCFLKGNCELFKLLLNNGCSIEKMEKLLEASQISPIHFICTQGYIDILEIYFPYYYYAKNYKTSQESNSSLTYPSTEINKGYPIHLAAYYGNTQIVLYFYKYFSTKETTPKEFDLNSLEERTGENCALIACRQGHLNLVVELHKTCKADFTLLNNSKENAIIVAIVGMNKQPSYSYFDIIDYLIVTVNINLSYMYEEILLLAQFSELVEYLEAKLLNIGIEVSKSIITKKYPLARISKNSEQSENIGTLFTSSFLAAMNEDFHKSLPSSIHPYEAQSIDDKFTNNIFK